jgi:competence protein ComEA
MSGYRLTLGMWVALTFLTGALKADLPAGFGKDTTVRVCGKCHSPERAVTVHQNNRDWDETITKMVKLGAQGSDDDFEEVLLYLTAHFGPEKPAPLNMNKATLIDLQTTLLLRRSQAQAIIAYRSEKGDFKSIDDLRNVPGLDFKALEAKKSRMVF